MHLALVSAYATEKDARAGLAQLPGDLQLGEYQGIWRTPAPYGGIVHLFTDEAPEVLMERGWGLIGSALPSDTDARYLIPREETP